MNQSTFTKGRREIAMAGLKVEAQALALAMPPRPLGAACLVDEDLQWLGVLTDGNVRRRLLTHKDIRLLPTASYRAWQPITLNPEASLRDATRLRKIAPRRSPRPLRGGFAEPPLPGLAPDSGYSSTRIN